MLQDIPTDVQTGLRSLLDTNGRVDLIDFTFSGGGCINSGGKLQTTSGDFFLKWNDARKFPAMFEAEAKGLELLRSTKVVDVPKVIGHGKESNAQFLILAFVEQRPPSKQYWEDLGNQLARLHRTSNDSFGLDHDNYIGSIRQFNQPNSSWVNFFIEKRLNVQLNLAKDAGLVDLASIKKFEALYSKLPSLLPEEKPSLLHGDLWQGNVISNEKDNACLIDPAVYYGNREADLAMTRLFGGFSKAFYSVYEQTFPLPEDHAKRVDLYNLYPLLVHLNLFGPAYRQQILTILKTYI